MSETYRIIYEAEAESDLTEIFEYIFQVNPSAARTFSKRVDKLVLQLSQFPLSGWEPHNRGIPEIKSGYRAFPIDQYLLLYKVQQNVVRIYRIIHSNELGKLYLR